MVEKNKSPKPTVGRIIHFLTEDGETLPAIITRVGEDKKVNLQVFTNSEHGASAALFKNIEQGKGRKQWSWPPRDGE